MDTLYDADYLKFLKFFAIGCEVSSKVPFEVRPVAHLIQNLPEKLQKILQPPHLREQITKNCVCTHQFWIEVEQINYQSHISGKKCTTIHSFHASESKHGINGIVSDSN